MFTVLYCYFCGVIELTFVCVLQHDEALAVDAVTAISEGLTALRRSSNPALLKYARYNSGTAGKLRGNLSAVSRQTGADCNTDPVSPWSLGRQLLHAIRKVLRHDLPASSSTEHFP